ncbi:hypothetical protein V1264_014774 [Littorina saxatilis]|uniref:Ectonucleotide pyrophosphatase/phosphodiesterase family member 6 n=2 Tax=Littorina saxatilis TaxID=31220 RepID=A0AAN9GK66_9CAEN
MSQQTRCTSKGSSDKTATASLAMLMLLTLLATAAGGGVYSSKVLLVSMDGFRWDYIHKVKGLGNFSRLVDSGSCVDHVNPAFATVTFPLHYTMVTGLYEESHGVVANNMYDLDSNTAFTLTYSGPDTNASLWWEGAEPIWVSAVKAGLKAGTIFWPGCDVENHGSRPTSWLAYGGKMTYEDRIRTAVDWLHEQNMQFVALYFDEPDTTGHTYGPFAKQTADKVREMDGVLGLILESLDAAGLGDDVNVIVTSDHGMADVNLEKKMINLYDKVDRSLVQRVPDSGPVTAIMPVAGREDDVMAALRKVDHLTAYRKEDIPERYHYTDHRRIMPIIVIADEGWELAADPKAFLDWGAKGDHGYDNELSSMKPIFFARGPNFRKGAHTTAISSVDIYPLLCELLGIEPKPHNGSLDATRAFLQQSQTSSSTGLPCGLHLLFCVVLSVTLCI